MQGPAGWENRKQKPCVTGYFFRRAHVSATPEHVSTKSLRSITSFMGEQTSPKRVRGLSLTLNDPIGADAILRTHFSSHRSSDTHVASRKRETATFPTNGIEKHRDGAPAPPPGTFLWGLVVVPVPRSPPESAF